MIVIRPPQWGQGGGPLLALLGLDRAVAVTRRSFRVSYVAVRVFVANDMADAIRQATAAGAIGSASAAA